MSSLPQEAQEAQNAFSSPDYNKAGEFSQSKVDKVIELIKEPKGAYCISKLSSTPVMFQLYEYRLEGILPLPRMTLTLEEVLVILDQFTLEMKFNEVDVEFIRLINYVFFDAKTDTMIVPVDPPEITDLITRKGILCHSADAVVVSHPKEFTNFSEYRGSELFVRPITNEVSLVSFVVPVSATLLEYPSIYLPNSQLEGLLEYCITPVMENEFHLEAIAERLTQDNKEG